MEVGLVAADGVLHHVHEYHRRRWRGTMCFVSPNNAVRRGGVNDTSRKAVLRAASVCGRHEVKKVMCPHPLNWQDGRDCKTKATGRESLYEENSDGFHNTPTERAPMAGGR